MEKLIQINQLSCHYKIEGCGDPIVLVHGWGQSMAFWEPLSTKLAETNTVYTFDLPGFGLSEEPSVNWRIYDYSRFLESFISTHELNNPTIIGHSFGGRVSATYAAEYGCRRLVLYSSSGVPSFSVRKSLFTAINYLGRGIAPNTLYNFHCSVYKPSKYKNRLEIRRERSQRMLDIFLHLNHFDRDLSSTFRRITSDTLLMYGERDTIVKPYIGSKIHELIPQSDLVFIPDATHFAHLEQPTTFDQELFDWLRN